MPHPVASWTPPRDSDSITFLSSPLQCLTTFSVKKFFPIYFPLAGCVGEEANFHLATTCFQVAVESGKVSPERNLVGASFHNKASGMHFSHHLCCLKQQPLDWGSSLLPLRQARVHHWAGLRWELPFCGWHERGGCQSLSSLCSLRAYTDSIHTTKGNTRPGAGRALSSHGHTAQMRWLYPLRQQLPNFLLVLRCCKCPFSPLSKLPVPTWTAHPLHVLQIPDESTSGRFVSPPVWDGGPQLTVLPQFHCLFIRDYNLVAEVPQGSQRGHHLKGSMPRLKSATQ